jgi:protocatechuate 3,4-dioxygenase beta subunit
MSIDRLHKHGRRRRPGRLLPLPLAGLAAAACLLGAGTGSAGAAAGDCPSSNPPNTLKLVAGSGQTAQLGKQFQTNFQVEVANTNGCPLTGNLSGVSITFDAPGSGASGIFASSGSDDATVGTDANGVATAPPFTANYTAGSYSVDAHSNYGTVELYLTNTANGLAASITASGAASQEATTNSQYGQPLQAQVLDANGKPVQGATVTFSIATGPTGASASFLGGGAQTTATTKSDGLATSPPLVANASPGRFAATASTTDLPTLATFSLTNHAAAETLATVDTAPQAAAVGTRYPRPLRARVLGADGQPIEGVTVTFTLPQTSPGAGASFLGGSNQATDLTDASGQASSPPLIANSTAGHFTATASAAGISKPLSYPLRNVAGRLTATHAPQQTTVGTRFLRPLQARLLDPTGRPIEGISVTFTLPQSSSGAGASFLDGSNQATDVTDANGRASSPPLLANSTVGRFTATATATGSAKPFSYALRNLAGKPATITPGAADGETTQSGTRFPIRLAVTVKDANGNPVAGATVTFTAPARGASGRFAPHPPSRDQAAKDDTPPAPAHGRLTVRVKTNTKGIAIAPAFTANDTPGGYVVVATANGHRVAFALVNNPRR